jgi:hypothetical protein
MGKMKIDDSLKAIAANNAARMGTSIVKFGDFSNHGITNAVDSIYGKDCVISVPTKDEIENIPGLIGFDTFTTNGRTSKAPYVWCPSTEGNKKVFISQLVRSVTPYKEENGAYVRDGNAVTSDTKLYNELSGLRDAGSILNHVAGKDIKVVNLKTGKTAAYTAGVITGLRDYSLPCFEIDKTK